MLKQDANLTRCGAARISNQFELPKNKLNKRGVGGGGAATLVPRTA